MSDFGSRLKKTMAETGFSQKALAERIGLSDAYISMLCANKNNPSKGTVDDIALTLGVNAEWLLTGNGPKKPELSREQAISEIVGKVLEGNENSFIERVIKTLSSLTYEEMEILDNVIEKLAKK